KDIAFAEQLKAAGFSQTGVLIFADDDLFWRGPTVGIYGFFRGGSPLHGSVRKPTGAKDIEIRICGNYVVKWDVISDGMKFAAIEVVSPSGLVLETGAHLP